MKDASWFCFEIECLRTKQYVQNHPLCLLQFQLLCCAAPQQAFAMFVKPTGHIMEPMQVAFVESSVGLSCSIIKGCTHVFSICCRLGHISIDPLSLLCLVSEQTGHIVMCLEAFLQLLRLVIQVCSWCTNLHLVCQSSCQIYQWALYSEQVQHICECWAISWVSVTAQSTIKWVSMMSMDILGTTQLAAEASPIHI